MKPDVIIYGTNTCPFCQKARQDYGKSATYYNVNADRKRRKEMLKYSKGEESVPVIVEGEKVTIGYGGA
ncbi:MAG: UXX-star (seleno)protein family 1 [Syntrophales bacterium]